MGEPVYRDRADAGRVLAEQLSAYRDRARVVVLALPRGGVPVGYEVARALAAPLDVFVVRKLGVPGHEELAMGAIASGGIVVRNDEVVRALGISPRALQAAVERETVELARREEVYRGGRPMMDVTGATAILVDDGLATGATMRAAISALRDRGPSHVAVAVPTAPAAACRELAPLVDDFVCAATPFPFVAVGQSYLDFRQTTDDDVRALLRAAAVAGPQVS